MLDEDKHDLDTRHFGRILVLGLCLAAALATVIIASRLFTAINAQVRHIEDVQTDNRTWNIAQLEVELLRLLASVERAQIEESDDRAMRDMRLRYDVFYSRQNIIATAYHTERFARSGQSDLLLAEIRGFIERFTPIVDSSDDVLRANIPLMAEELRALHQVARPIIVESFSTLIEDSVDARNELSATFQNFALAVMGLTGLMALMVILVLQQNLVSRFQLMASKRMQHNLHLMIEASLDAVLLVDDNGIISVTNQGAMAMLSPSGETLVGQNIWNLVDLERNPRFKSRKEFSAMIDKGRFDLYAIDLGGRSFPAEAVATEAKSLRGASTYIVFLRDMTEVVEREQRLTEARNAARRGEEAKARFLAVMSHEMRTPLNGILSAVELLRPLNESNQRADGFLDIVQRCGLNALEQVNNVLELTRMDAGDQNVYPVSVFCPAEHLRELAKQNMTNAEINGNQLLVQIDPESEDVWVRGRLMLFTRVVYNFLGNALKFTTKGTVTIRLERVETSDPSQARFRVTVEDTGVGIAEEDIARIFENFETLDTSYARAREGSGLGLGIAKLAAETLGGTISVSSTKGIGSAFSIELSLDVAESPQKAADKDAVPLTLVPALEPRKVLIAEDNAINREVLTELLVADGHSVEVAVDGNEAIAMATESEFDAILMDINMPNCDGVEATRAIRATGRHVPIFAVTAMAGPEQQAEFLNAGFCDVITKPISRPQLREALQKSGNCKACGLRDKCGYPDGDCAPMMIDEDVLEELTETLGQNTVAKFALRFASELSTSVEALDGLIKDHSYAEAAKTAHKTAGSAATMGFTSVAQTLKSMQRAGESEDEKSLVTLLTTLRGMRSDVDAELKRRGMTEAA